MLRRTESCKQAANNSGDDPHVLEIWRRLAFRFYPRNTGTAMEDQEMITNPPRARTPDETLAAITDWKNRISRFVAQYHRQPATSQSSSFSICTLRKPSRPLP